MTGTRTALLTVLLCSILIVASSCAKSRTNRTQGTQDALQQTASERMSNLRSSVVELQRTISQLPTNDIERDKRLTTQALASTASALAAVEGPRPSGAYRQQVRVIENSRTQLERSGPNVPTEPAVDSALRAAYNALIGLRDGRFSGNQQVAGLVSEVGQKIPQLDTVRGPLHTLVVTDVLSSAARALAMMTDVVENRASDGAATRPANQAGMQATTRPVAGAR
ncbi:MAG TPA: hypothetical protein VF669_23400 [Tepidisphaeraceae bacterium]|jgi:hypothetical protein